MTPTSAASVWPPGKESGPSREAGAARIGERLDSPTTLPEHSTEPASRQVPRSLGLVATPMAERAIEATIRKNVELLMRGVTGERRLACRESVLRAAETYRAITGEDWRCPADMVDIVDEIGGLFDE